MVYTSRDALRPERRFNESWIYYSNKGLDYLKSKDKPRLCPFLFLLSKLQQIYEIFNNYE
jgi:hypothetical protein